MVDILTKGKNGWEFYEVKSNKNVYSTAPKIKDIYAGKNIDKISRFYRSFSIVNYLLFGVSNKN